MWLKAAEWISQLFQGNHRKHMLNAIVSKNMNNNYLSKAKVFKKIKSWTYKLSCKVFTMHGGEGMVLSAIPILKLLHSTLVGTFSSKKSTNSFFGSGIRRMWRWCLGTGEVVTSPAVFGQNSVSGRLPRICCLWRWLISFWTFSETLYTGIFVVCLFWRWVAFNYNVSPPSTLWYTRSYFPSNNGLLTR